MNYRKRRATDELLPTTRPPKIPRSNHTYLQSASEHAALLPNTALSTRWVKAAEDLYTLVGDTAGAMLNFFLRGGGLFSRPESQQDSAPSPREPQQLPSPPSTSPSVQSISPPQQPAPLPADLPPPPRRRQPSKENAVASSSTQIDRSPESSRENVTNTGLLTPTTSQTSAGSSSTSFLGLNPELSAEQRVRAAIHEAARRQNGLLRQHKPRRKHIFEQRHKKEVREDRIKTREEMITQLWNIRRGRGGMYPVHRYERH
ncbi:hypothetical protein BC629DRAFT_1491630 [Irpex lacteus]|nr:hypothetical protein BC629DRAFT_1491630 [Irpex lacteus]